MVAVGLQDALRLPLEPLVDRQADAEPGGAVGPGGDLDLVVEAELVRRAERGLRRAPRVEADRVETVRLRDADDALPGRDVGRRVPGLREDRALERAAKEGLAAVDRELGAARRDLAQAGHDRARVPPALRLESRAHPVERRRELVPGPRGGAERQRGLEAAAARVPRGLGHRRGHAACGPDVERLGGDPHAARARAPGQVADPPANAQRAFGEPRVDLQVLDPDGAARLQLELAYDPVPVALRVVRHAVRVQAHVHDQAVVHPDRQGVRARGKRPAELDPVRGRETVAGAPDPPVEPDDRLPVGPLEVQQQAAARPFGRDHQVPLVPGGADVVAVGLQPERHLHLARLAVRRVAKRGEEGPVHDLPRPGRVDGDLVAVALGLQHAGQPDRPAQTARFAPAGDQALVPAVELETPHAVERDPVGDARRGLFGRQGRVAGEGWNRRQREHERERARRHGRSARRPSTSASSSAPVGSAWYSQNITPARPCVRT